MNRCLAVAGIIATSSSCIRPDCDIQTHRFAITVGIQIEYKIKGIQTGRVISAYNRQLYFHAQPVQHQMDGFFLLLGLNTLNFAIVSVSSVQKNLFSAIGCIVVASLTLMTNIDDAY